MTSEENLLFGLIALRQRYIKPGQFAEACAAWRQDENRPMHLLLVERGWISAEQRDEIQRLVEQCLADHEGDTRTALITVTGDDARRALEECDDAAAQHTLALLPPGGSSHISLETIDYIPESRSRYTLTRIHGKGGLGQVWLARDKHLRREVALKEILPHRQDEQDMLWRLVKEAQITGQLEHPNIIPVYELALSEDGKTPYYTMRFLRGESLHGRITRYHSQKQEGRVDPLELLQLLNIFVSICNALAYAHSRGVIHRDLKPQNVMLGDFGEVLVLDWGLSKLVEHQERDIDLREMEVFDTGETAKTRDGEVVGTPAYMSPEQADGRRSLIDAQTDIYGLGAILFVILTGRPPHKPKKPLGSARDTMELLARISTGPTPEPRTLDASIPPALDAICSKAMSKQRGDRYRTANELAQDIQRWLGDEPVSAYREPWQQRLRRWMRRHRTWTQAAAAALLLVALASTAAAVLVNRARQQELAARLAAQRALAAEQAARDEATRRFREARATVDKALTGFSDVLTYFPGVQPIRAELLEEAARDYERFAEEKSDDLELRVEAARALIRLGDVRNLLAQYEQARVAYAAAAERFGELHTLDPGRPEFEYELANSQARLGSLLTSMRAHQEAAAAFAAAIDRYSALLEQEGRDEYRMGLASALLNRAELEVQLARYEDSEKTLAAAETEFLRMVDRDADLASHQGLAAAQNRIGQLLSRLGQNQAAVDKLETAVDSYEGLLRLAPHNPPYLEGLAASRVNLANALLNLGRDAEVIQTYQAAIEDYHLLLETRPGVPHYRENLALGRTNLARVLYRHGQVAEAKQVCAEAFQEFVALLNGNPNIARYQENDATCRAIFGLILRELDEDELAETALRQAVARLETLCEQLPDVTVYALRLAVSKSSLGRTLQKAGRTAEAQSWFEEALDGLQRVLQALPEDPYTTDAMAWCHTHLGDLQRAAGNAADAGQHYARALTLREDLRANPQHLYNFAWLLACCDDHQIRDPGRAVELASRAAQQAAENAQYHFLLALAHFRAGDWPASRRALEQSQQLRSSEDAFDGFLLAMLQWQDGRDTEARATLEAAGQLMQQQRPGNLELRKLRDEAAELLGGEPRD